jgi:hypothetical protein
MVDSGDPCNPFLLLPSVAKIHRSDPVLPLQCIINPPSDLASQPPSASSAIDAAWPLFLAPYSCGLELSASDASAGRVPPPRLKDQVSSPRSFAEVVSFSVSSELKVTRRGVSRVHWVSFHFPCKSVLFWKQDPPAELLGRPSSPPWSVRHPGPLPS